jgi:hypothetical protein
VALDIYTTFYGRVGYEGVGQAKAVVFSLIVAIIVILQMSLHEPGGREIMNAKTKSRTRFPLLHCFSSQHTLWLQF